jgi:predicted transcriptional regulator
VTRLTLRLPDDLVEALDTYVASDPKLTRSALCADALLRWIAIRQEAEIARYYETMPDEERAENAEWARLSAEAIRRR